MTYLIHNEHFVWAIWKIEFLDDENDQFKYYYYGRTNIFHTILPEMVYASTDRYSHFDEKTWKIIHEYPTMDILLNLFKDE